MLHHIIPADVASLLLIPYRPAEQRLHPPWRRIARVFRQLPTVLALGAADEAFEKETNLSSRLRAPTSERAVAQVEGWILGVA
jgi:hypothetical protein